jgi:tetratricopeptide (TPR) repeat protein
MCALIGGAQAQPQVAWLGIQDRDDMSSAAAAALDGAIGSALAKALAPRLTVETITAQAPQARRALQELDLVPSGASQSLGDGEARAVGLALGAQATIRAWAEVVGDHTRLTTFTAAVHRRRATIHQERASAPPEEAARLAPWAEGLARGIAARIAPSIADLIRNAPDSAPAFAAAGNEFLKEGAPRIAALEFDRAISLAPKEAAYYLGSARAYLALGEMQRARHQLDIALEFKPFMGEAWLELGRVNLAAGDAAAAIREFNRAIELGAGNEARMSLARALAKTGDLKGAQEQYRAVAQSDPANAEAAKGAAEIAAALAAPGQVEVVSEAAQPAGDSYAVRRKLLLGCVERGDAVEAFRQVRLLLEGKGEGVNLEPSEYVQVARLMDREADAILRQARSEWEAVRRGAMTREQVTDSIKGLHQRSDALARAAEGVAAPPALERGYRHRVLAYNLLNQSDFALLRYLERRENPYYDEAVIARQASVAELGRAWDLDAQARWPTRTAAEE